MTRTVKVNLAVDEQPYVRGMDKATSATERVADAADDATASAVALAAGAGKASDSLGDAGEAATATAHDFNDLRRDAERLDRQIDQTSESIRDLAREIARTGDEAARADLSRKLTGERGKLRDMTDLRKLIDVDSGSDVGAQLAEQVSVSFAARLGPLLARAPLAGMNPAALAIGAPLAVGVAAIVGGAVSGAIIGGGAGAGVVGGLAIAAKDPAVQAAAASLGVTVGDVLGRASSTFVPVTISAIDKIRMKMLGLEPEFKRLFSASSTFVDPLLDGLMGAVDGALPDFIDMVEQARPVVDAIGEGLTGLGEAAGDVFQMLADNADEGAMALRYVFLVIEAGIRTTGAAVESLTWLFDLIDKGGILLTHNAARYGEFAEKQDQAKGSSSAFSEALAGLRNTAGDTADKVQEVKDAFDDLFGSTMGMDRAQLAYKQGLVDLKNELTDGKRTLDDNTAAGKENKQATLDQIDKIKDLRQARLDQGETLDTVNTKYDKDLVGLRAQLLQLGYNRTAVDELIGKYREIPNLVATTVGIPGATEATQRANDFNFAVRNIPPSKTVPFWASTGEATAAVVALKTKIDELKSKHIYVTGSVHWTSTGDLKVPGGTLVKNARGGVYEHAAAGVLRDAQIASPTSPAQYAWAEPSTGGEAFIPKYGDRGRALDILSTAAGWHGAQVVAGGPTYSSSGGGKAAMVSNAYSITVNVPPTADPAEVGRQVVTVIQQYERGSGKTWRES